MSKSSLNKDYSFNVTMALVNLLVVFLLCFAFVAWRRRRSV